MPDREPNGSWDPFAGPAVAESATSPPKTPPARGGGPFLLAVILVSVALGAAVYGMLASIRISHDAVKYATGFGVLLGLCMMLCTVVLVVAAYRGLRHRRLIDVAVVILALFLPPATFVTGMSAGVSSLVDNLDEDIAMLTDASSWLLTLIAAVQGAFE